MSASVQRLRTTLRQAKRKLPFQVFHRVRWLIPGGYWLVRPLGMDFKLYVNLKESFLMWMRMLGRYEPQKTSLIQQAVKPGMTVFDIGVNNGYHTMMCASLMNGQGRVLAFEPSPVNAAWTRKAIEVNGFRNVELFEFAVSDRQGTAEFHLSTISEAHSLTEKQVSRSGTILNVATDTLDRFCEAHGIETVDFIKLDVEGAELHVLRGGARMFERSPNLQLAMDIHPQYGVDPREVIAWLEEHGFSVMDMRRTPIVPPRRATMKEVFAMKSTQ